MSGISGPAILRILVGWPLCLGIGLAAMALMNGAIAADPMLREINEILSFSVLTWFVAPALHWFLLAPAWQPPGWPIWTLAIGAVSVLTVFVVQIGLLIYFVDPQSFLEPGLDDIAFLFDSLLSYNAAASMWDPLGGVLIPLAVAGGYVPGLAMISWRLAVAYLVASLVAAIAIYLVHDPIMGAAYTLEGGDAFAFPFVGVAAIGVLFGLAGSLAIIFWAAFLYRENPDMEWQEQ